MCGAELVVLNLYPVLQFINTVIFSKLLPYASLEKEMETHSSILAWRIPWTKEPGRLQSMGS